MKMTTGTRRWLRASFFDHTLFVGMLTLKEKDPQAVAVAVTRSCQAHSHGARSRKG